MIHPVPKLAIVTPTIGRNAELRRMLASLARQSRRPDEVVIVDEDGSARAFVGEFPQLAIRITTLPGSACVKRNAGIRTADEDMTLVGFMDDDIVLEPQAIESVMRFWESAPADLGGTCLNVLNDPPKAALWLKGLSITSRLGLYGARKGGLSRGGFHVPFGQVSRTLYVDWVPTYCVVYARHLLDENPFDEFFKGYSYLEDLDLSYRIGKNYRLAVVADARFYHYPSAVGRPDSYLFGKKEVINRLYFVSKHGEFSRLLCWVSLGMRMLLSVLDGLKRREGSHFKRAVGNLAGFFITARHGLKPV